MAINQDMLVHYNYDDKALVIIPFYGSDISIGIPANAIIKHGWQDEDTAFETIEEFENKLTRLANECHAYRNRTREA